MLRPLIFRQVVVLVFLLPTLLGCSTSTLQPPGSPTSASMTPTNSREQPPDQVDAASPTPQLNTGATTLPVAPQTTLPTTVRPAAPMLFDDFSQPTSGWTPLFVSQEQTVNGYSAEGFGFSTASPGELLYNLLPTLTFAPSHYAVEIQPLEGHGMAGLLFEVYGDLTDYTNLLFYGVGITTSGDILVLIKSSGLQLQVIPAAMAAIPPLTQNRSVHLEVRRYATELQVIVDGKQYVDLPVAPQQGTVGFFARAEDRLAVRFDNLLLTAGTQQSESACSQLRPLPGNLANDQPVHGADVQVVERRLTQLGYAADTTGSINPTTVLAIRQFQQRNGLEQNGGMDTPTWCRLLSSQAILANSDQEEQAFMREQYRPVLIDLNAALPMPLLVSVRGAKQQWQIALALPGRTTLHYIDTGGDARDATWQPEQGLLAFTSERTGKGVNTIWLFDSITGVARQISPPALDSQYPAWSHDGQTLMFTGTPREGKQPASDYTYSLSSDSASLWGDTKNGWSDWSPVGTVLFTRVTTTSFDLYVANTDSSGEVNLTNTSDYHEDIAAWSPDGARIAFVRNPKSNSYDRQIWIMQADGSELQQVTQFPVANSNPTWLDNTTIVFANQRSKNPDDDVRQPYILRLPADLRRLSASEERIWYYNRFDLQSR